MEQGLPSLHRNINVVVDSEDPPPPTPSTSYQLGHWQACIHWIAFLYHLITFCIYKYSGFKTVLLLVFQLPLPPNFQYPVPARPPVGMHTVFRLQDCPSCSAAPPTPIPTLSPSTPLQWEKGPLLGKEGRQGEEKRYPFGEPDCCKFNQLQNTVTTKSP